MTMCPKNNGDDYLYLLDIVLTLGGSEEVRRGLYFGNIQAVAEELHDFSHGDALAAA